MSHMYAEPAQEQQRETAFSDKQTETLAPSRPPVVCAAPPGEPQGGLLDWFRENSPNRNSRTRASNGKKTSTAR